MEPKFNMYHLRDLMTVLLKKTVYIPKFSFVLLESNNFKVLSLTFIDSNCFMVKVKVSNIC